MSYLFGRCNRVCCLGRLCTNDCFWRDILIQYVQIGVDTSLVIAAPRSLRFVVLRLSAASSGAKSRAADIKIYGLTESSLALLVQDRGIQCSR
jgi:hypothetical protein